MFCEKRVLRNFAIFTEKDLCQSPPEVRKGVLRNLAKFTGKQLCQSLFLNKVAGLKPVPESLF